MTISFQLYSARGSADWVAVLDLLAAEGYDAVEGFGGVYRDPGAVRAALDRRGLEMASGHFGLADLEDNFTGTAATARTLGIRRLFAPFLEASLRPGDAAGWADFARRLAAVNSRARDAGFGFGWHNHDFEFETLPDGSVPMQILLEEAPEIDWEADIGWIARAGADPLAWIDSFGNRITTAHVKDIAPDGTADDEDGWADVGEGEMDWPRLTAVLRHAGCDLFVLEHDNPSDAGRFARRSMANFKGY